MTETHTLSAEPRLRAKGTRNSRRRACAAAVGVAQAPRSGSSALAWSSAGAGTDARSSAGTQ